MLLECEGYEVIGEAEDGQSALEAVSRLHPDVVLLDVQLPDLDGFEVAARLTENGTSPAIVLTSSRQPGPMNARPSSFSRPRRRSFQPASRSSSRAYLRFSMP